MTDEADRSVVLVLPQVTFLGKCKDGVGHFPVCQILLQIAVRAVITSSPPALISSAGMLSNPSDFPFFSDCTAASTSLRRRDGHPLCLSGDSPVRMDLQWPCGCTAQNSILSICSVSLVFCEAFFLGDLGQ